MTKTVFVSQETVEAGSVFDGHSVRTSGMTVEVGVDLLAHPMRVSTLLIEIGWVESVVAPDPGITYGPRWQMMGD